MTATKQRAILTPSTPRGEARDKDLRNYAATLFLQRGYDAVSLDEIIREVGGSKSNIYSFYGGKDGLFCAAIEDAIMDLTIPLKRLQLKNYPLRRGLEKFARTLFEILLQDNHLALQRLVVAEGVRHPRLGEAWYRVGPEATSTLLSDFLREKQRSAEVRRDIDPARVAVLFHDMVLTDMLNRAIMKIDGGPTPARRKTTIEAALALIVPAIAIDV